jgi:hypothetical protein
MLKRSIDTIRALSRRSIRAAAWLALVLLASLTIFLFTATAGPVPTRVHPWAEFGCQSVLDGQPGICASPIFACMSRCGRFYATVEEKEVGDFIEQDNVQIHRCSDHSLFARIKDCPCRPYSLSVNADESLIAIHADPKYDDYPMKGRDSFLFDSRTGKPLLLAKEGMSRLEYSPDGQQIGYISENRACFEPIHDHVARKVVNPGPDNDALWAFFDEMGNPNALILRCDGQGFGHAIELVDARTLNVRWRLEKVYRYLEPYAFSPKVFAVRFIDDLNINICSMSDGKKLRNYPSPLPPEYVPGEIQHLSPHGTFFLFSEFREGIFSRLLSPEAYQHLPDRLTELEWTVPALAETKTWRLVDLRTDSSGPVLFSSGTRFLQAGIQQTAGFHADGSCLTTIHDDGLYDWDLPPRMRWFTPWAWGSLMATLAMGWVLWKSRSRTARQADAAPVSMQS